MKLTAEQRIAAPRQRVWEALNDPIILRESIPRCQSLERESDTRFAAIVEVKMGPISARFKGAVSFADLNPPNAYTLVLEGSGGMAGAVKGRARVQLREEAAATVIAYDVEAEVAGRMAQLGGPIIDASAKLLADQFFGRFAELVSAAAARPAEPVLADTARTSAAPSVPAARLQSRSGGAQIAWVVASVVAALLGFAAGRARGFVDSDSAAIAIGLLLVLVAYVGFEYGRRSAAPVLMLDSVSLRKLIDGARE